MTQQPPNLEIISSPKPDAFERRRVPRISLMGEQFRLDTAGTVFSVTDLSEQGMALRIINPDHQRFFTLGSVLQGHLNLRGDKFGAKAQVRHIAPESIGCEFEAMSEHLTNALRKVLNPESLGAELKAIPSNEKGPSWYHGPSGTDLLYWRGTDAQVNRICIFILGSYVQWEAEIGTSTGRTRATEERNESWGAVHFDTLLLEPDAKKDNQKLQIAKTLVISSNLPQDLKIWIAQQLET